jgi:hypothetical protein
MELLQIINDALTQLLKLTPEALLGLFIIACGYVLRGIKWLDNRWIPLVCCVLGGSLYPFIAKQASADPDLAHPYVRLVMIGFLIGLLAWVFHEKILSRIEDRIPGLRTWLERGEPPQENSNNQPPTTKA